MIERGITVCYTDGGPSVQSTAELAFGADARRGARIPQCDAAVRAGRFQLGTPVGIHSRRQDVGLLGLGRIGAQMAGYCNALGMRVRAWSQNLTDERRLRPVRRGWPGRIARDVRRREPSPRLSSARAACGPAGLRG